MDEDAPRYWMWMLIGVGGGLFLSLLLVLTATPNCGFNPSVRTAGADTATMPTLGEKIEKGRQAQAHRGYYLTTVAGCAHCHTPVDPLTGPYASEALSGGAAFESRFFGTLYSANLTPDLRSGIGQVRDDRSKLRAAMRGGLSSWGNSMHPAAMPWHLIGQADTEDLECIITYLTYTTAVSRAFADRGAPGKNHPDGVAMGLGSRSKDYEAAGSSSEDKKKKE